MSKLMEVLIAYFLFKIAVSETGIKRKSCITLTTPVKPCSRDRDEQAEGGCHLLRTPLLLLLILHISPHRRPAGCRLLPRLTLPAALAATPCYTN